MNVDDLLKFFDDPQKFFMFSEQLLFIHTFIFVNVFNIIHVDKFAGQRNARVDVGRRLSFVSIRIQRGFF